MSFAAKPGLRYDMLAIFGPSHIGEVSRMENASAHMISFETTPEAAADLMPRYFRPAETPIVTYARMTYHDVDYLGGRSYRELVFSIRAVYEHGDRRIETGYIPVLWVDDFGALTAGRELQGLAKLGASFGEVERTDDGWSFDVNEYGNRLIDGRMTGMTQLDAARLAKVNAAAGAVPSLGWKYIPGLGGTVDVDYPTLSMMRWQYREAWSGRGDIAAWRPSDEEAPYSARVMRVLAALPAVKPGRSFVGYGAATIDRKATERLPV